MNEVLRGDVQFTAEMSCSAAQSVRERRCQSVALGAGIVASVAGSLVLLGWALDITFLKSTLPGAAPMTPLTATCFCLCGAALAFQSAGPTVLGAASVKRGVSRVTAAIAVAISLTGVIEYALGLDIVDESMFHSGHMAWGAAIGLLLVALALSSLDVGLPGAGRISTLLALMAALMGLIAIVRYLYGVEPVYRFLAFPAGAPHTATLLVLLSVGALLSRPRRALPAVITSDRFGGWMARRLLPVAFVAPIGITWMRVAGQRAGFYGPEFGLAGIAVANVVFFVTVVWLGARSLNRLDDERRLADQTTTRFVHELADTADQLRASEERFRLFMSHLPAAAFLKDTQGRYLWGNAAWRRQFPDEWGDITGKTDADLWPADTAGIFAASDARVREDGVPIQLSETTRIGAEVRQRLVSKFPVQAAGGGVFIGGVALDTTESKRLETQLYQAQKLEAIGLLAGGVAHDFNNLLTVILGFADVGRSALGNSKALLRSLDEIQDAALRAAALTKQLLAFGRKQVMQPRMLSLKAELAQMQHMLRRVIRENVNLNLSLATNIGVVNADPVQIQQIVLNLTINAQDAMPDGGSLTIETANADLDDAYVQGHRDVQEGPYVMLAVSDTGTGMDAETLAHIFEPFFTTKIPGKGTGLGLATVYGIVKQNGGHIWVYSEPGHGTSFKIYLPRVEQVDALAGEEVSQPGSERTELQIATLLIVEDEDAVRSLIVKACMDAGYRVLEACNGEEATALIEGHHGMIDLLVTDVIMPGISGRALADRIAELRPQTKILFCSGYAENSIVHHGVLAPEVEFLQKPFTPDTLLRRIRSILSRP